METTLGRIRLSEQIEESILNAIKSGEFQPGHKLPSERALMDMFNVGRPSVKEALLMLERKGFVSLRRGVAPVVIEPTPKSALDSINDMVGAILTDETNRKEFFELRMMLESAAVFQAAAGIDETELSRLEEALERCKQSRGEASEFRDADKAFHIAIMKISGNSVVSSFHEALIDWGLFRPKTGPEIEKIHDRVINQHESIVRAIEARDQIAAVNALQAHLLSKRSEK